MNAAGTHTFRGYRSITEVVERMTALAEWLRTNKPDCESLTLRRRDLDLLQRWPAAAAVHHIVTNKGVTYWRGFVLRADKTAPRYEGRFEPVPRP
jgi:hypothetical protein